MNDSGPILVVLTDTGGQAALAYAAAEAARRQTGVSVVLVHPDPATISCTLADLAPVGPEPSASDRLGEATRFLARCGLTADAVTTKVVHTPPAAALVALSDDAAVLVVEHEARDTGGDSPSFELVCRLAGRAHCPVSVVPAGWRPDTEAATVRVGVAGTDASREVVKAALEECERRGTGLQLVHGWSALLVRSGRGWHGQRVEAARCRNEMLSELHDLVAEHRSVPVGVEAPCNGVDGSLVGEPSLTALVVMGRRHDPTAPRGDLGPTVRHTLRKSPVPVLVVDPTPALGFARAVVPNRPRSVRR